MLSVNQKAPLLMSKMSEDICRLCFVTDDLIWVFGANMPTNLSEIIKITSGVEILRNDVITQMVCNTCYQLTKKMYQFRTKSIKNDKELKARHTRSQLKPSAENIKQQPISGTSKNTNISAPTTNKYKFAHPSIKEIMVKYPNVILPLRCLKSHVGAYITLLPEEVDEYFQEKGMTNMEIEAIKKEAANLYSEKKILVKKGKKRKDTTFISPVNKKIRTSSESSNTTSAASESSDSNKKNKSLLEVIEKVSKNVPSEDPSVTSAASESSDSNKNKKSSLVLIDKVIKNSSSEDKSVTSAASESSDSNKNKKSPLVLIKKGIKNSPSEDKSVTLAASESSDSNKNKKSPLVLIEKVSKNSPSEDSSVKILSDIRIVIKEKLNKTNINNLLKEISKEKHNENSPEILQEKLIMQLDKEISNEQSDEKFSDKPKEKCKENHVSPLREILKNTGSSPSTTKKKDILLRDILLSPSPTITSTSSSSKDVIEIEDNTQRPPETIMLQKTLKQNDTITKKQSLKTSPVKVLEGIGKFSKLRCQLVGVSDSTIRKESTDSDVDSSSGTNTEKNSDSSLNTASDSRNSSRSAMYEANKKSFIKALQLTPKVKEGSNMPDLSLVSLTRKSYTLYTCKVCDSQHNSLKDLKVHSRKTHTKCPFCNKRLRSLLSRDLHVSKFCAISKSIASIKNARLVLKKIEDDEEIRKKYPNLFEDPEESSSANEMTQSPFTEQETPVECDSAVTDAISELEQFLNPVEEVSEKKQEDKGQPNPQDEGQTNSNNNSSLNVICISDDESEAPNTSDGKKTATVPKINIVRSEFLSHINLYDSDVNIFKKILTLSQNKPIRQDVNDLLKCRIEGSNNSRVKVFKDLRKFLHHYKIPVELYNSQTVSAEVKPRNPPTSKTKVGLWNNLTPLVLTPYMNQVVPTTSKPSTSTNRIHSPLILNSRSGVTQKAYTNAKIPTQSSVKTPPQTSIVTSVQNTTMPTMNFIAFAPTPSNTYPHPRPTLYLVPNTLLPQSSVQTSQPPIPPPLSVFQSTLKTGVRDQPLQNTAQQFQPVTNPLKQQNPTVINPATVKVSNPVSNLNYSAQRVTTTQPGMPGIRVKNLKELS